MTECVTPVGRIVWGNPLVGRGKVDNNNQPVLKDGVQVTQWSFGLAIPKQEMQAVLWPAMQAEAATIYPNGLPQNFAWKFKDGDALNDKGQPFPDEHKGCFVLAISTEAFAPRVVRLVNGAYSDMLEGIKTGDYVRVGLNIKVHAGKQGVRGSVPGLYINPSLIEFIGYGEEIRNGPDPMALFGGQAAQLPAGASATPTAGGAMPGMVQQPAAAVQQPGNPMTPQPGQQPMPGQAIPAGANQPGNPMTPQPAHGAVPGHAGAVPGNPATMHHSNPGQPVQPAHDFVNAAMGQQPAGAVQQPGNPMPGTAQPGAAVPGTAPLPGMLGQS